MKDKQYELGMTVKDLKILIKDWPEYDACGELTEVFVETGFCLSGPVIEACTLNNTDILFRWGAGNE